MEQINMNDLSMGECFYIREGLKLLRARAEMGNPKDQDNIEKLMMRFGIRQKAEQVIIKITRG